MGLCVSDHGFEEVAKLKKGLFSRVLQLLFPGIFGKQKRSGRKWRSQIRGALEERGQRQSRASVGKEKGWYLLSLEGGREAEIGEDARERIP
jgi:hypothetical protein